MRILLFSLYVLLCLAALTWPGYAWLGNRIQPFVLGLPFSLVWVVGWVMLTFIVLVVFHVTGHLTGRAGGETAASSPAREGD